MFVNLPVTERFVYKLFILENGKTLRINENRDGYWTLSIINYET